jgi:predicted nucleic acid-binding protein
VIYLDSSALLKLLVEEAESAALGAWLGEHATTGLVSSEVARLEVVRAARRIDPALLPASRALVSQLDLVPLGRDLIDAAADVGEPTLRSLDAIHLASALTIRDELTWFVAYDRRLAAAAVANELSVTHPQ